MRANTFWSKVHKTDSCWVWTGTVHKGYGRYSGQGAHRLAYELLVGPIADGLELDHLCGNTLCVNPQHLEPVTRMENMRRRYADQTHCKAGHEFTPENTYTGCGVRQCRACQLEAVRRYQARKVAS